jgi:hypothetical protein
MQFLYRSILGSKIAIQVVFFFVFVDNSLKDGINCGYGFKYDSKSGYAQPISRRN